MTSLPDSLQAQAPSKPIHSLVLDTGPLIKNDPLVSTLLAKTEQLYILPSVISEIKDAATRSRVETTLLPFVKVRSPQPESMRIIQDFARRTGDLSVLSRPDIQVLALTYDLECERNGGDWRLRSVPGQKRMNGKPAQQDQKPKADTEPKNGVEETVNMNLAELKLHDAEPDKASEPSPTKPGQVESETADNTVEEVEASDSEDGGWITPANIKKEQAKDAGVTPTEPVHKTLQAAVLTSDFAMQNVALRMSLNLVAPTLTRITHIKNWVLRCHGCFHLTKDTSKQFCPSCGQATLTRTSCSTDEYGNFKIHLKKNFQWNNRGNVYSVPKPVHGTAHGRLPKNVGGKNGWGQGLILTEDQKEYTRATEEQRRERKKDLMDEDYLPNILTGHRNGDGGKIRVGAGRNVNSRKKR